MGFPSYEGIGVYGGMVDTLALGANALQRESSNLSRRTKIDNIFSIEEPTLKKVQKRLQKLFLMDLYRFILSPIGVKWISHRSAKPGMSVRV